ncbi:MAG: hypothetical protein IIZ83_08750 [Oscillospiraceae bacterium]|nr:hypothetical protein [Oscillospiraceae bacterium]
MSEGVIIAIISAVGSLIVGIVSAVISAKATGNDVQKRMEIQMAVTDTKLEELTREVRKHNNFAERIPVIEEKISVANHRIDDLEKASQK